MKKVVLLSLLVFMSTVTAAQAGLITQTRDFSGTPDYTADLLFNKFDESLGALTAINITMGLMITGGELHADNDGEFGGNATLKLGAEGRLASPDVNLYGAPASVQPLTEKTIALQGNDGDGHGYHWDGGNDNGYLNGIGREDTQFGSIDSNFFTSYIGAGEIFRVAADVDTYFSISGMSGVAGSFSPVSTEGFVTIGYEYTPVPLPATIWLFGPGLLAMAGFRKKR